MAGSLFNIALNFSQQEPIWIEILKYFIMPLVSVFIGAILAHMYNLQRDAIFTKKQTYKQMIYIATISHSLILELKRIKNCLIKYPKKAICANRLNSFKLLQKMELLYQYNVFFPYLFDNINQNYEILISAICKHNNYIKKYKYLNFIMQFIPQYAKEIKNNQETICHLIDKIIIWLLILQDKITICDLKYINCSLFHKHIIESDIPGIENKKYKFEKDFNTTFNKSWEPITLCQKCIYWLKKINLD